MMRAIETFVPDERSRGVELGVEADDQVMLTGVPAPAGWLHCSMGDRSGLVPAAYLTSGGGDECDRSFSPSPPASPDAAGGAAAAQDATGAAAPAADEDVDDGIRVCIERFKPQAGAPNELPLNVGDKVQLVDDGDAMPDGWVLARSLETELIGLVPEQYLKRVTQEETEEEAALRQQKEKYVRLEQEFERTRSQLLNAARVTKKQKDAELAQALALTNAEAEKRQMAEAELAAFKAESFMVLKAEMEAMEAQSAAAQKQAWIAAVQQTAREGAEEQYAATRTVLGRKLALETVEKQLSQAEVELQRIEAARTRAQRRVLDLRRRVEECAAQLAAEEASRDVTERTLLLLPGLREMLEPTQAELRRCMETVSQAVTRNAEQSAQLLATLAGSRAADALCKRLGAAYGAAGAGSGVRGGAQHLLLGGKLLGGYHEKEGAWDRLLLAPVLKEVCNEGKLKGWDRVRSTLRGNLRGRLVQRMREIKAAADNPRPHPRPLELPMEALLREGREERQKRDGRNALDGVEQQAGRWNGASSDLDDVDDGAAAASFRTASSAASAAFSAAREASEPGSTHTRTMRRGGTVEYHRVTIEPTVGPRAMDKNESAATMGLSQRPPSRGSDRSLPPSRSSSPACSFRQQQQQQPKPQQQPAGAMAPAAGLLRPARSDTCGGTGRRAAGNNRKAPVLYLNAQGAVIAPPTSAMAAAPSGTTVAATSTSASNPSNHLLARQQQSRQNFARQQNLRRTESDAQLLLRSLNAQQPGLTEWQQHERRLQIGKRLLQRQSEDLQFALQQATSGLGKDASSSGSSLIPMPELVVEYVPAGRVKQRFDRSSAQHVRRVQAARDAAAARSQLMGSEQLSGSTSDAFKSLQ